MASAQQYDPLVGRVIDDRFEILERIGEGGMGVVYKARQSPVNRLVAIKVLNQQMAQDPTWVQRFQNEARASSQLQHPNTIRLFDSGQTREGQLYIAMEYLDGKSLRDVISEGPMHPARVVKVLIQCCASLAEAHAIGIIHRDIKPDNVFLLSMPGSPDFVKLLDFSVAKLLQDSDRMRTQAGVVFGTPQYMSPEQGRGLPLDGRSDLYALGILAYEMLTSQVPFNHENAMMVLQMHMRQAVPPLPPQVPPPVQAIVYRALEKEPGARYQSAGEMMQHCQQVFMQMGAYPSMGAPQGPQMGGSIQMGPQMGQPMGQQMGGAQMGHQIGQPMGQQMGGPPQAQQPRRGFAPQVAGAEAKTIIAGSPIDLQAMLQQQAQALQQPSGAEDKTMIAGGGQFPNLAGIAAASAGMGSGGFPPAQGPGPSDDSGPPKTIMLQDTEGIISLAKQQQQVPSGAVPALPATSPTTGAVVLDDDEGAGVLYWMVCLSGGLIVGVLAYLAIRLLA